MPVVPIAAIHDVPTFKILVEGAEINSTYQVMNISVTKEYNKITQAEINILDGNVSSEDFEISNTDDFIVGKNVEIQAGYQGEDSTIFKGVIVKHGIKVMRNEGSLLNITLKNKAYKSALTRNNIVFNEKSDSEIIEEIIDKYGLDKDVDPTDVSHESLMQFNCSDWDFINMRAEANSGLVFTHDDKIVVKKPDISADAKLTLSYGSSILEFEAEMDARTSFQNYKATSWDYSSQELTEIQQSGESNEIEQGNITASNIATVLSQEQYNVNINSALKDNGEIDKFTESLIQKNNFSRIRGRVKSIGYADINPGDVIELTGVGDRFNGKTLVSAVSHAINGGHWITNIQFGLDNKTFAERFDNIIDRKANGLLPAIHGLQIGKVMQLQDDPLGEHRILIKLPIITDSDNTFWARVSTLDAGNNRGTFFRPEIDDEVIVGFIDDNPGCAVVLGMLNSSALPAPVTAEDANNIKGIYTREQMKMEFDDDKKSIAVETPNGNKINISEEDQKILIEDQSGNKITLDTNGIKLEDKNYNKVTLDSNGLKLQNISGSEVSLTSSGIKIMSPGSIELQGAQLKISAAQVQMDAAMVSASGILKSNVLQATSIISASYTPGAGNVW